MLFFKASEECHIVAVSPDHDLRTFKAIKSDDTNNCKFAATDPLNILSREKSVPNGTYVPVTIQSTKSIY